MSEYQSISKSEDVKKESSESKQNEATASFEGISYDFSPGTLALKSIQSAADDSPRSTPITQLQAMANASSHNYSGELIQLQAMADARSVNLADPIQRKENNTGLPDNLKTGMENLSGMSMDDVKVHRNSDKPAQLQAHAFAQGTDIHLGPGQEKHLPHELGHVVQQKQGRVKPTLQMKGKVNVNDDAGLEKEADVLGAKALQASDSKGIIQNKINSNPKTQKADIKSFTEITQLAYDKDGRFFSSKYNESSQNGGKGFSNESEVLEFEEEQDFMGNPEDKIGYKPTIKSDCDFSTLAQKGRPDGYDILKGKSDFDCSLIVRFPGEIDPIKITKQEISTYQKGYRNKQKVSEISQMVFSTFMTIGLPNTVVPGGGFGAAGDPMVNSKESALVSDSVGSTLSDSVGTQEVMINGKKQTFPGVSTVLHPDHFSFSSTIAFLMGARIDDKLKDKLRELSADKDYLTIQRLIPAPDQGDAAPIFLYYTGTIPNDLIKMHIRSKDSPKGFHDLICKLTSSVLPISISRK